MPMRSRPLWVVLTILLTGCAGAAVVGTLKATVVRLGGTWLLSDVATVGVR